MTFQFLEKVSAQQNGWYEIVQQRQQYAQRNRRRSGLWGRIAAAAAAGMAQVVERADAQVCK